MLLITVCPGATTTFDRSSRLSGGAELSFLHYLQVNNDIWILNRHGVTVKIKWPIFCCECQPRQPSSKTCAVFIFWRSFFVQEYKIMHNTISLDGTPLSWFTGADSMGAMGTIAVWQNLLGQCPHKRLILTNILQQQNDTNFALGVWFNLNASNLATGVHVNCICSQTEGCEVCVIQFTARWYSFTFFYILRKFN